jgi:superfamily II DNA/RNA helicase
MTDIENNETEQALVPALSRAPVRPDSPTFAELGVRAETVEALAAAGITRAFAIQEYAVPIALRGTDLIGQAPTGTGKTLGFGLPLLERVTAPDEGADGRPQALVVVPTRELGLQVARDIAAAGKSRGIRVLPIYGGVAYEPQVDALKNGVEILVGTPGRLLDLAKQKQLKLGSIRALVLDEADRMLDLGFLEDVENPLNKLEMVARMLQARGRGLTMIFTRTKRAADRVAEDLDFRGFAVAAVHGDLGQGARERALRAFRSGKIDVLVATDVAARGLDVSGVTHVINYDCPEDPDTYTHRIGRTGRAGATGVAVTFVDWEDMPRWVLIDKSMGLNMPQPPETYHTSTALYTDLDIPTDVSGTLPTAERSRAGLSAEVEEDLGGGRRRGRDGGRSPRGRGRRDASEPSGGEIADKPQRQRRRRRMSDSPLSRTDDAAKPSASEATDPAVDSAPAADAQVDAEPRKRTRRRSGAPTTTALFSDGADATAAPVVGSPVESTAAESGDAERGERPRRRRRGGRGAGSAADQAGTAADQAGTAGAGEMTGGSEAGVGTTA